MDVDQTLFCNYSWDFPADVLMNFLLYLFFPKNLLKGLKAQISDAILRVIGYF